MLEKLLDKYKTNSKVERVTDDNTRYGISAMRIIAKSTLTFKTLARDLRGLNNAFSKYLKLHNVQPTEGEKLGDLKKSLSQHDDIKVARVKATKERREKPRTFMASVLDKLLKVLFAAVVGTLLSVAYVTYKIVEFISPYVSKFIDTIVESVTFVSDALLKFFTETDFSDLFLTTFKKYLGFISFGLISEDQVDDALGQAGSFYKEMIIGIGGFIKDAVNWLAPKLQSIGRYVGKDILGVDLEKLEKRRTEKDALVKRSQELEKEYSELEKKDKDLTDKKDKLNKEVLKKQEEAKKRKETEQKKKEEAKPAPAPAAKKEEAKPAPTPAPVAKKEEAKPAPVGKPTPIPDIKPEAKEPTKGDKEKPSNNLESLVKKEKPEVILNFEPSFERLLIKLAQDFKGAMSEPIQVNSGFRTGDYQKGLWLNLTGKNKGYNARVKDAGGFDNLTGAKQDSIIQSMRTAIAAPSKKSGVVIEIDKYGEQPGQVVGKKVIPATAGKGHEAGLAADISTADLENKTFLKKMGFNDTDSYLKSIGLWRSLLHAKSEETWHVEALGGISNPDTTEKEIDKSSREVAKNQREQSKPQNPKYVDARTTNNNVVQTDRNIVVAKT